jgi:YspA, cpYpsA-related SLOG family
MLKIIVAGSRDFNDYELLEEKLNFYIGEHQDVEIISGMARGADRLGEKYAREKSLKLQKFLANWGKYGKNAGYLRNEEMARYASHAIIFWNGKSKGTAHMIELCKKYKINYRVIRF